MIRVQPGQSQKYIVVSIASDNGSVQSLWGDPNAEWHNNILEHITAAGHHVDEMFGGGRIFVDPDKKEIYIWGTSDRFGPAPRPLVEELLEAEYPDHILKFNQEPK